MIYEGQQYGEALMRFAYCPNLTCERPLRMPWSLYQDRSRKWTAVVQCYCGYRVGLYCDTYGVTMVPQEFGRDVSEEAHQSVFEFSEWV